MQADQHVAMENFLSGDSNILVATSVAEGLDVPACNILSSDFNISLMKLLQPKFRGELGPKKVSCQVIHQCMNMKEIQNSERLELVNKIIKTIGSQKAKYFTRS